MTPMTNDQYYYYQVLIASPTQEEINHFSEILVKSKLVSGCLITEGDSHYWWNNELVKKHYWNLQAFTLSSKKDDIISAIEKISSDECPIISFTKIEGNKKFLNWIDESIL